MPGYGVPEGEEGLLSWGQVVERLEAARHYWMATVRPDGRPHAVPTWGAWVDGAFYTEGGGRKIGNLRANPAVAVHLESGEEVVILEGTAEEISAPERPLFERIDASYGTKYGYNPATTWKAPTTCPILTAASSPCGLASRSPGPVSPRTPPVSSSRAIEGKDAACACT
jgi:nitroimidazol reductase NimA-like FMN-containing flavoprotein (pyridoxamine 5'-phosphate oxidase superfamily)